MKAIDKIVFNELALRRAVVLPGLGTLGVTRRTAQVDGDKVKAPVNEVVFSKHEAADASTVVGLMEAMGLPEDTARTAYREWYDEVLREDGFSIAGVGAVKDGRFTPSTELAQMLNRQPAKPAPVAAVAPTPVPATVAHPRPTPPPVKNKKGSNRLVNILLMIAIALLLAVICCYVMRGCSCCRNDGTEMRDADAEYEKARGVNEAPVEVEPTKDIAPVHTVSGNYYVIAGSFIYESNADELIARYRREFPDLNVEKLMTDAWVMVSVWRGVTPEEGAEANRRLRQRLDNHDMWVYRKR